MRDNAITRKMPRDYHEWRELWHHTLFSIGWLEAVEHESEYDARRDPRGMSLRRIRELAGAESNHARYKWQLREQARRIKLRMEAEQEAKTASFMRALREMIEEEEN